MTAPDAQSSDRHGLEDRIVEAHRRSRGWWATVILAVLLLTAGVSELARQRIPLPRTRCWRLVGGILSGLFGGLVGNQGGIRAAALLGFQLPPRKLVATATASALLVDAARVPVYLASAGSLIAAAAPLWLAVSVGVTLGTFLGVPV